VVIEPGVSVPTAIIFSSPELTRDTKPVKITDFSEAANMNRFGFGKNDLQVVASKLFPPVAEALEWLRQFEDTFGGARMTGSGACVFCAFEHEDRADEVLKQALENAPPRWKVWKAKGLARHPLADLQ
jgi:4-diphosphocytidyl-2-C-methyl-D-erythritol kinase